MTAKEMLELAKGQPDIWARDKDGHIWWGYDFLEELCPSEGFEPFTVIDMVPRGKISNAAAATLKEKIKHEFDWFPHSDIDGIEQIIDVMTEEVEE